MKWDYVKEHREKLEADPQAYADLLRRQNMLHCVWHVELQERIAILEKAIREKAELFESYAGGEVAHAAKLHRYADELRSVL